jgi:hypothetical protein
LYNNNRRKDITCIANKSQLTNEQKREKQRKTREEIMKSNMNFFLFDLIKMNFSLELDDQKVLLFIFIKVVFSGEYHSNESVR